MNVSSINHVVLYAKNFYRHTGNVIKDLQSFCQLDGAPYWQVSTPEKLLKYMKRNYTYFVSNYPIKNWVDASSKRFLTEEIDEGVRWEDDPIKKLLYHYLITYSIYIPLYLLSKPKYDKYHLPQFNVRPKWYIGCNPYPITPEDFDALNDAAYEYMHKDRMSIFDDMMNDLIDNDSIEYEDMIETFKTIDNEELTVDGLKNEIWKAYESFVNDHLDSKEVLIYGFHVIRTKHFVIEIQNTWNTQDIHLYRLYAYQSTQKVPSRNRYAAAYKEAANLLLTTDYTKLIERVSPIIEKLEHPAKLTSVDGFVKHIGDLIKDVPSDNIELHDDNIKQPTKSFRCSGGYVSTGQYYDGMYVWGEVMVTEYVTCKVWERYLCSNQYGSELGNKRF